MNGASIYVRLSKEAGESNTSLQGMLDDCRALAMRNGLTVVAEHVDNGLTGSLRDRPEFLAWLDDARSGRASVLISPVTDRLTREGVNAAAMVLDVHEGKDTTTGRVVRSPVRIITADGLDSERDFEAFRWRFVIAAEVARGERARIVARAKDGRRRLNAAGRYPGGSTPFGYSAVPAEDGKGWRLAVDPAQAAQVRSIVKRVVSGETINAIVMGLNRDGVPSPADQQRIKAGKEPKGAAWRVSNLTRLLDSPSLLGQATTRQGYGYGVMRGDDGMPVQRAEPILTPAEQEELRGLLLSRAPAATSRRKPQPFLGVARCECGAQLYEISNSKKQTYYRCGTQQQTGTHPGGPAPRSVRVEQMIPGCLAAFAGMMVDATRKRRVFVPGTDTSEELRQVSEALNDLDAALAGGLYRGPERAAKWRKMVAGLEERKEALEAAGTRPEHWVYEDTGELWTDWLNANATNYAALGTVLREAGVTFVLHAEEQRGRVFDLSQTPPQWVEEAVGPRWTVELPPGFFASRSTLTTTA